MSAVTVQIQVKVSWWFRLWLEGLALVAQLSGREPCPARFAAMAQRGVKVKVRKA